MAFQKVNGMPRNGRATPDVLAAVSAATDPAPLLADGGATRVEIDFKRQVLFLWRDGGLLRILPVSTGNGTKYCADRPESRHAAAPGTAPRRAGPTAG